MSPVAPVHLNARIFKTSILKLVPLLHYFSLLLSLSLPLLAPIPVPVHPFKTSILKLVRTRIPEGISTCPPVHLSITLPVALPVALPVPVPVAPVYLNACLFKT